MWSLPLPKNKKDLAEAIQRMVAEGVTENVRRMTEWVINEMFLRGQRGIQVNTVGANYLETSYEDDTGKLHFRLEYALQKFQVESGRFAALDLRPRVVPLGYGLDSLRDSSISQAVLDHLVSEKQINEAKRKAIPLFLKAPLVGIGGWLKKMGNRTYGVLEVIHPRELLSVPARVEAAGDVRGMIRHRQVPLTALREWFNVPRGTDLAKESEAVQIEYGQIPGYMGAGGFPAGDEGKSIMEPNPWGRGSGRGDRGVGTGSKGDEGELYAWLEELFLDGPEGTVARYVAKAGNLILDDVNYEEEGILVPRPIGLACYADIGSVFGRTFLYPLVAMNDRTEGLYELAFRWAEDLDPLGIILLPTTSGISERDLKVTTRPKIVPFEPIWQMAGLDPKQMTPANVGDFPLKLAGMSVDMLDKISGQSGLYQGQAPGRADSSAAFQMLNEMGNVGLRMPQESLADAFSTAYRSILYLAKSKMGAPDGMSADEAISVRAVDSDVVGVVIEPMTGRMGLADNPLPGVWDVEVGVQAKEPKTRAQRIYELEAQLKLGTITPEEYRLTVYRERLDLPVGNKAEWQTYRMAMFNIRLLFRDGKTPGDALAAADVGQPRIALGAFHDFMASPEFALASEQVREAFLRLKEVYMQAVGTWPDNLPYPEQLAGMAGGPGQAQQSGQGQGQQMGMSGQMARG